MTYPWQPVEPEAGDSGGTNPPADLDAWSELFATTIAHLAAQLTMTQLRLRALATTSAESGAIDPAEVQANLQRLAAAETGRYLRENLGPALVEAIDTDELEREVVSFLRGQPGTAR
jgi:hypothetical protein